MKKVISAILILGSLLLAAWVSVGLAQASNNSVVTSRGQIPQAATPVKNTQPGNRAPVQAGPPVATAAVAASEVVTPEEATLEVVMPAAGADLTIDPVNPVSPFFTWLLALIGAALVLTGLRLHKRLRH